MRRGVFVVSGGRELRSSGPWLEVPYRPSVVRIAVMLPGWQRSSAVAVFVIRLSLN